MYPLEKSIFLPSTECTGETFQVMITEEILSNSNLVLEFFYDLSFTQKNELKELMKN